MGHIQIHIFVSKPAERSPPTMIVLVHMSGTAINMPFLPLKLPSGPNAIMDCYRSHNLHGVTLKQFLLRNGRAPYLSIHDASSGFAAFHTPFIKSRARGKSSQ